jgi:hypothetical protein
VESRQKGPARQGCSLQLTEEKLVLFNGKVSVACPWAELWRVVPSLRPRLERAKPEVLGVVARAEVLLDYLGGYPLYPKKDSGVQVVADQFGLSVL